MLIVLEGQPFAITKNGSQLQLQIGFTWGDVGPTDVVAPRDSDLQNLRSSQASGVFKAPPGNSNMMKPALRTAMQIPSWTEPGPFARKILALLRVERANAPFQPPTRATQGT